MNRKKMDVYQKIRENFLVPLFSSPDAEAAKKVVEAIVEAGSGIIELTHREDNSFEVFKEVVNFFPSGGILAGAGSIVDEPTAAGYVNAGASFIVGPTFNSGIMKLCSRRNILYIPGCGSLNEIVAAYEEGAVAVKLFPAGELGGPGFLKSIKAPCPWIEAIPTGGVEPTEENLKGWLDAGASAVGMGSRLIRKELIKAKEWGKIKNEVTAVLKLISRLRG